MHRSNPLIYYFLFVSCVINLVSSDQKRDKRTIEETLADIRARKRQKPDDTDETPQ